MYEIYMILENPKRSVFVERTNSLFEAIDHMTIYYNKNPKHYYVLDLENMEVMNIYDI